MQWNYKNVWRYSVLDMSTIFPATTIAVEHNRFKIYDSIKITMQVWLFPGIIFTTAKLLSIEERFAHRYSIIYSLYFKIIDNYKDTV